MDFGFELGCPPSLIKQKLHDHPRSIETASYMLAFEWWESFQIPRDQKYSVLLDAVRSTGKLTTAARMERLLEERRLGHQNFAHAHGQPERSGEQLLLNSDGFIQPTSTSAVANTGAEFQAVPWQTLNRNTVVTPKSNECVPQNKGVSDKIEGKGVDEFLTKNNLYRQDTRVGAGKGATSHIKHDSDKGSSEKVISESEESIDASNPDLDALINRNGHARGGYFQTGVLNGQTGTVNGQTGVVNCHTGMVNGQTGVVNGHTGMVNGQTGVVNGHTGMVNGQTGIVNGQTGIVNGQTTVPNTCTG